VRNC